MSWIEPTLDEKEYVQRLRKANPEIYSYAQILSLALRVDPLLLRNLRMKFLPNSNIKIEHEFWFSPLIYTRNVKSAVIHLGISRELCNTLATENSAVFNNIKKEIINLTRGWSVLDKLEQEMRWAIIDGDVKFLNTGIKKILRTLIETDSALEKKELARWAKGVLFSIVDLETPNKETRWLVQYLTAILGGTISLPNDAMINAVLPSSIIETLPSVAPRKVSLRMFPEYLEVISYQETKGTISISLPLPTKVMISTDDCKTISWVNFFVGAKIALPKKLDSIHLRMIDGSSYLIKATNQHSQPELTARDIINRKGDYLFIFGDDSQSTIQKNLIHWLYSSGQYKTVFLPIDDSQSPVAQLNEMISSYSGNTPFKLRKSTEFPLSISPVSGNESPIDFTCIGVPNENLIDMIFQERNQLNFTELLNDLIENHNISSSFIFNCNGSKYDFHGSSFSEDTILHSFIDHIRNRVSKGGKVSMLIIIDKCLIKTGDVIEKVIDERFQQTSIRKNNDKINIQFKIDNSSGKSKENISEWLINNLSSSKKRGLLSRILSRI